MTSGSVREAAWVVGKTPASAYKLRAHVNGAAFKADWLRAVAICVERVREIAIDRAFNGRMMPVMKDGVEVGERLVFNDRLLIQLMRLYDAPAYHAERAQAAEAALLPAPMSRAETIARFEAAMESVRLAGLAHDAEIAALDLADAAAAARGGGELGVANDSPNWRDGGELGASNESAHFHDRHDLGVSNESPNSHNGGDLGVSNESAHLHDGGNLDGFNESPSWRDGGELGVSNESPNSRDRDDSGVSNKSPNRRDGHDLGVSNESPNSRDKDAFGVSKESPKPDAIAGLRVSKEPPNSSDEDDMNVLNEPSSRLHPTWTVTPAQAGAHKRQPADVYRPPPARG